MHHIKKKCKKAINMFNKWTSKRICTANKNKRLLIKEKVLLDLSGHVFKEHDSKKRNIIWKKQSVIFA